MTNKTNVLFEANRLVFFIVDWGGRFVGWELEGVRHGASSITGPGTWPLLSPQPASFTLLQQQVLFIHPTLPLPPKTSSALFPPPHWQGLGVYMLSKKKKKGTTHPCLPVVNHTPCVL